MAGALRIRAYVSVEYIGGGTGTVFVGQSQAQNPGYGQGQTGGGLAPGPVPMSQTRQYQDAVAIVGTPGSITLAQISTALTTLASDLAGASGTPVITPAELAIINSWATGTP